MNLIFRPALLHLLLAAMVPFAPGAAYAGDEAYLRDAIAQTVEIRTAIEYGFGSENKGTFVGAGFVIDKARGWIATARHVVAASPSKVVVSVAGSPYADADKLYVDPLLDLAVLRVSPTLLRGTAEARLGCEDIPEPGDTVVAVGHPISMKYSVTRGIVSRMASIDGETLIQTDAAINTGNSGEPLVSMRNGRVIGMTIKLMSRRNGAGFALPVEGLCRVTDLLRQGRDPSPPEWPVSFLIDQNPKAMPKVARVWDSPKATALRADDVIVAILDGGQQRIPVVNGISGLSNALRGRLGNVRIDVIRAGEHLVLPIMLTAGSLDDLQNGVVIDGVLFGATGSKGVREFGSPPLRIYQVDAASEGELQGAQTADFLMSVNGNPLTSLEELATLAAQPGKPLNMVLRRIASDSENVSYQAVTLPAKTVRHIRGARTDMPEEGDQK